MLRISKLTDYAIIIMSFLALAPEKIASAAEIASQIHLSVPTVSKLLKIVCEAGLVTSFRGTGGGYQLSRPVQAITLADIVSAIEGNVAMTECCMSENLCVLDSLCALKENWKMINKMILKTLASLTLADMMRPLTEHRLTLKGIPINVTGF